MQTLENQDRQELQLVTKARRQCGVRASCKRFFSAVNNLLALAIHSGTFYIFGAVKTVRSFLFPHCA